MKDEPGVIKFSGPTQFASGFWFGVELDRPVGKNDGSIDGVRYFAISKSNSGKYGVFVREAMLSSGPNTVSRSASPLADSHLHVVIDKLQVKLKTASQEIRDYKEKLILLESKNSTLESQLEMQATDHDFLLSTKEALSQDYKELKLKYEELKTDFDLLQEEAELNKQLEKEILALPPDSIRLEDTQKIMLRNKQLEAALLSLQTITDSNELNMNKEINQLKSELSGHQLLSKNLEDLRTKLSQADSTIASLQEQLDSVLDLEKVVEHLTSQNEELSQKVVNLTKTVEDLTEIHELDKSLEENQKHVEEELRISLAKLLDVVRQDKGVIQDLENKNKWMEDKLNQLKSIEVFETGLDDLRNELETFKARIASLSTSSRSDKVNAKIYSFKLAQLQTAVGYDAFSHLEYRKVLDIIHLAKSCICYVECIDESIEKQLNRSINRDLRIQYSNVFVSLLEVIITLFEYNFQEQVLSSKLDNFNSVLGSIELWLLEFNNNDVENDDFYFSNVQKFIADIIDLMNFENRIKFQSKIQFEFILKYVKAECQTFIDFLELVLEDQRSDDYETPLMVLLHNLLKDCRNTQVSANSQLAKIAEPKELTDLQFTNITPDIRDPLQKGKTGDFFTLTLAKCISSSTTSIIDDIKQNGLEPLAEELQKNLASYRAIIETDFKIELILGKSIYEELELPLLSSDLKAIEESSSDDLKEELNQARNTLAEKNMRINEFQLNIKLLERNMESLNEKYIEKISHLKSTISQLEEDHNTSIKRIEELMHSNEKLEKEVHKLLQVKQEFDFHGKYTTLKSENQSIDRLALMEEILLLRKITDQMYSRQVEEENELSWLDVPLIYRSNNTPSGDNLNHVGRHLQHLSGEAKFIRLPSSSGQWVPKNNNAKYINLSLKEHSTVFDTRISNIISSLIT